MDTCAYNPYFDEPSVVTDACGKTACYKYDFRGRKVAEWGTAIQPACFGYDDDDRMTSLATFRAGTETITTDPSSRTDGDVTTWAYHATTGLEVSKTYADGKGTVKTYDAFNRLSTETDAREKVKTYSYEHVRGLLLGITYSDSTTAESFVYNHLGQLTLVTDSAGIRAFGYNAYGEQETDSLLAKVLTPSSRPERQPNPAPSTWMISRRPLSQTKRRWASCQSAWIRALRLSWNAPARIRPGA